MKDILYSYSSVVSEGVFFLALSACIAAVAADRIPLLIKDQGSLTARGTVIDQPVRTHDGYLIEVCGG